MKCILIVDDDADTRAFLRTLLQQYDYGVIAAHDGGEAWDLLQHQAVDLILTDVAMPHLNGYQLCQRVKT